MASLMQSMNMLQMPGLSSWIDGTAVTNAAGVTQPLSPSSQALSALQGGATISAMAMKLLGGVSTALQGKMAADMADLEAEQKALAIRSEAVKKIGAARVAYAASGLDISSAGELEASLQGQSEAEQRLARAGGKAAGATSVARGIASLTGSAAEAAGKWAQYKLDLAKRG